MERPSSPIANPCDRVPGLWFVKIGLDSPDILECNFDVDARAALKWDLGSQYVFKTRSECEKYDATDLFDCN